MARIIWDDPSSRPYETGVDQGVFYAPDGLGEAWNGLSSVKESPSDADGKTRYIDGVKTRDRQRPGDFAGVIEAYTYPDSFYENVLLQRRPSYFGLSYRVKTDNGYKIHLVYNAQISPAEYLYAHEETDHFKWAFSTKAIGVPGSKPTAHLVIDTSKAYSWTVEALENAIYGSDARAAWLPSPTEVLDIFEENSILRVVDNGDGTFTVTGPDDAIKMLDPTTFQITWPTAVMIDEDSYTIHSL